MKIRDVPQNLKPILPVTAIYNLMRSQNSLREADGIAHDKSLKGARDALAQIALAVFALKKQSNSLPENLRNSFIALEKALNGNGVTIVDYAGCEVTDELMGCVSIEGWDVGTASVELVGETFTPEVMWNGELLHMAQVFCNRAAAETELRQDVSASRKIVSESSSDETDHISDSETPIAENTLSVSVEGENEILASDAVANNLAANIGKEDSDTANHPIGWVQQVKKTWRTLVDWILDGNGNSVFETDTEAYKSEDDKADNPEAGQKIDEY